MKKKHVDYQKFLLFQKYFKIECLVPRLATSLPMGVVQAQLSSTYKGIALSHPTQAQMHRVSGRRDLPGFIKRKKLHTAHKGQGVRSLPAPPPPPPKW